MAKAGFNKSHDDDERTSACHGSACDSDEKNLEDNEETRRFVFVMRWSDRG